jgi:signal transduction histidine kinase
MTTRMQAPGDGASRPPPDSGRAPGQARKKSAAARHFFKRRAKPMHLLNAAIGCVLVAVLGVMIARTRTVDFEAHNEVVALLRQLKQVDAEWNVDVLRYKTGLRSSSEVAAGPVPLIDSLETALRRKAGEAWRGHDATHARIQQLLERNKQVMDEKAALIERFKSQHTVLRNSSRYLPAAAAEVLAGLDAAAPASKAQVWQAVEEVLTQALVYINTHETLTANKITESLARLQRLGSTLPPDAAERVAGFSAHATTVLKQEQLGNQLLADLAALPTARSIDELSDAHAQEHERLLVAQQKDRWLLLGYSLLLLGGLAHVAWRLFRSYRLLNKTNVELQRANAELKESQMHLVQSEKMSALGQMVAGIAHEINTPLAYVKGTFEVLREQVALVAGLAAHAQEYARLMRDPQRSPGGEPFSTEFRSFEAATQEVMQHGVLDAVGQLLKDGLHGIEQISEIVTSLKNFSRLDRAKVSEFSVQEGLESTLVLARNLLKKNRVEVRREFGEVPRIHGSPAQINQVFLNLITNAVHAIPEGRAERGVITLRTLMEGRDMLRVEIQDNGVGIPDDVLPRIFDPFFTTKAVGQGTGMGLSISSKIVQEHGGMILVDSVPGTGTVFAVLLPVRARRGAVPHAAGALASA